MDSVNTIAQSRETALSIGVMAFVGKDDPTPLRELIVKTDGRFRDSKY